MRRAGLSTHTQLNVGQYLPKMLTRNNKRQTFFLWNLIGLPVTLLVSQSVTVEIYPCGILSVIVIIVVVIVEIFPCDTLSVTGGDNRDISAQRRKNKRWQKRVGQDLGRRRQLLLFWDLVVFFLPQFVLRSCSHDRGDWLTRQNFYVFNVFGVRFFCEWQVEIWKGGWLANW